MIVAYLQRHCNLSYDKARQKVWLVDSKGLVSSSRTDVLAHHKQPYAHVLPSGASVHNADGILDAVKLVKPSVLIGVSAQGGTFTEAVCKQMASTNRNPVIFALSNPTSKAECTAQQAYQWTNGKCVFASGSPFDPVTLNGKTFVPGQGNNAYIFPGVGLGAIACGAKTLTDDDLAIAASALAKQVTPARLETGCAYPPLSDIRNVSLMIAAAVAENIMKEGRADPILQKTLKSFDAIKERCRSMMYEPKY